MFEINQGTTGKWYVYRVRGPLKEEILGPFDNRSEADAAVCNLIREQAAWRARHV